MPGWLSWLERTAHRVFKQCSDFFLGYREAAGSNPAPGTQIQPLHLKLSKNLRLHSKAFFRDFKNSI